MLKHLPQIAAHLWLNSIEPVCILLPIILALAWFPTKTEHPLTLITSAHSQIHQQHLYIKDTTNSLHFPSVVCDAHWSNTNMWTDLQNVWILGSRIPFFLPPPPPPTTTTKHDLFSTNVANTEEKKNVFFLCLGGWVSGGYRTLFRFELPACYH